MSIRSRFLERAMRRASPVVLIALLAGTATHERCSAQCEPVENTGCGSRYPSSCRGSTGVGQGFTLYCNVGGAFAGLLGMCARPPITLGVPIMCSGPCNLGVDPNLADVTIFFHVRNYAIPNDPQLIGATFCIQCIPLSSGCLQQLHQASRFTITP